MKRLKRWLIGTSLFFASAVMVAPAHADDQELAAAMAALKSSIATHAIVEPGALGPMARPQEVCELVQKVIDDSADARRLAFTKSAIESVFVDRAVERFRTALFPSDRLNIASSSSLDMSGYDGSWPRQDQSARIQIKLLGDWWASDFGARHGNPELSVGLSGTYRETPDDPQWIEYDSKFTFDAMLKIDRLSLYGEVIDHEADAPFAGRLTDNRGAMVQAGYFLIPDKIEPFVRYEWPGLDAGESDFTVASVGVNYYMKPHAARFSLAVVWTDAARGHAGSSSDFDSGGLIHDGTRDAVSVRAQLQLLF